MKLYIESALRIKGRLLLCALLVFGLAWGALYLAKSGDYTSSATVWVEKPIYLDTDPGVNIYLSPATTQANMLSELLSTRQFTLNIAQKANIPMPSEAAANRVAENIQRELSVDASGTHLVRLTCTAGKGNYCKEIITQAITLFIKELDANRARQADVALQLYEGQLATSEQQMIKSREAYNRYLLDNPAVGIGSAPNADLIELQQQYTTDRARYAELVARIENVRAQSTAATEANNSFFRVMDPAGDVVGYAFALKDLLRNSLIALVMALLTIVAITLVSTWVDPAIYTLNDASALVLAENESSPELLIGVIPYNKALAAVRQRAAKETRAQNKGAGVHRQSGATEKSRQNNGQATRIAEISGPRPTGSAPVDRTASARAQQ